MVNALFDVPCPFRQVQATRDVGMIAAKGRGPAANETLLLPDFPQRRDADGRDGRAIWLF